MSMVNDNQSDNRSSDTMGRFPAIQEDEPPRDYLISDYPRVYQPGKKDPKFFQTVNASGLIDSQ